MPDDISLGMRNKKNKGSETLPFGKILGSIAKERGLTIQQLANLAGVRSSVAQSWLAGSNPHDLKAVAELAKALGCKIS
jgi:transcriptional regulator with XRE-family HTH domain